MLWYPRLGAFDMVYADLLSDGILSMHRWEHLQDTYAGKKMPPLFPVPITEKLLIEKCGFSGNGFMSGIIVFPNEGGNVTFVKFGQQWLLCYKDVKIPIDALHELQQCWWVFFKKELEIK